MEEEQNRREVQRLYYIACVFATLTLTFASLCVAFGLRDDNTPIIISGAIVFASILSVACLVGTRMCWDQCRDRHEAEEPDVYAQLYENHLNDDFY